MRPLSSFLLAIIASGAVLAAGQVPIQRDLPLPPRTPQEPTATFRAGVRAIQIDAVVTNEGGNPVRGLTADDFDITERGKPQPITTFEAVDIPIETQPADLADTDVVTNEGDGRIYLIVIDSISAINGQCAKRELRKFFADHFGPSDSAAVMTLYRSHFSTGQDFTSNRRLLIKGIDSFVGYNLEDTDGENEVVMPGSTSPFAAGSGGVLGFNRMDRLKDLTEFLLKIPGRRKAMVLVTEAIGFDATDFKDYMGTTMNRAGQAAHAAMTAATRGNIAIYPISVGGQGVAAACNAISNGLEASMELRSLAAATGGFAHVNSNNFHDSFARLVQEQSVYYMLGFNSGEDKDNGRYVPVKVTVKRPGLKVLARDGYVAPFKGKDTVRPAERRAGVAAALGSPISVGGVTLRAFAAPFKGSGKTASIAIALETDPHGLGLTELPDGSMRGSATVRLVPTDARAKVLPQTRHVGDVTMAATARGNVERKLHVLTKVDLPPGRYQLRMAVGTAQRGGSVIYDLEVPDYTKKDLAMSGVVVRGSREPEGMFLPARDPLRSLPIGAATTSRTFENSDRVAVFAEIYDTTSDKPHSIDLKAEIRSENGEVTPVAAVSRTSDELKSSGGTLRLDTPLPLAKLAAGRYVLSVQARSSAGGDTITRSVPFRVE